MQKENEPSLIGFSLPAGELLPGFLIPVFQFDNRRVAQGVGDGDVVQTLYPLSDIEPVFDLETMSTVLKIKLVMVSNETGIGKNALHAFYDTQHLYVGLKVAFLPLFDALMSQIISKLWCNPICLAGLHDFLGKHALADELRRSRSADCLNATAPGAEMTARISRGSERPRRTNFPAVLEASKQTGFIEDVSKLAALRARRGQTYNRVARKPLYAEA
ncbi:hypothetical protein [Polaromonas sp. YR568]|uniref:hypothetical protein n=1 Tax=Polaromonas sp. YR568 TaxID=1855301 RepID=UPI00398BE260